MLFFKIVDFQHILILLLFKVILPLHIEFLHRLITNLDIILQLPVLNIGAEFVLIGDDFLLEHADFLHEVFVEDVLEDFAAFVG